MNIVYPDFYSLMIKMIVTLPGTDFKMSKSISNFIFTIFHHFSRDNTSLILFPFTLFLLFSFFLFVCFYLIFFTFIEHLYLAPFLSGTKRFFPLVIGSTCFKNTQFYSCYCIQRSSMQPHQGTHILLGGERKT